jgi:putative transposase
MIEAAKGFRRFKAHKHLPIPRVALAAHQAKHAINSDLEQQARAAYAEIQRRLPSEFQ